MDKIQTPTTVISAAGRLCPRCGAAISGFGPEGLCGVCLLDGGLAAEIPEPPAGPPAQLPQNFGDYEIIGEIARGGMGVVLQARQISLNRIVALKVIRSGDLAGPLELRRFHEEAQTAASLQHPNIVAIHEVGERDGLPFFSMDYVAGQNLAQLVQDNPLPAQRAAGYLRLIAGAVHHAHLRGVLHRDLKPSNVLIDAEDRPRVTDFGLAKHLANDASLTLSGQILGSPSFMSPEQALGGRGGVGPASDVYSLGALLYHLLTGRPPFVAESVPATLRLVAENDPASLLLLVPGVPGDLETICLKCLQKDPAQRYATAQELADDLGRFLADEPIQARPVAPVEKFWRWCRRNRALAVSGAVAGMLLLTVAIGSPIAALHINRERQRAEQFAVSETQQRQRAEDLAVQGRLRLYAARINLAQQVYEEGDGGRVLQLLNSLRPGPGEADLRGFEWRHLWQLCHSEKFIFPGPAGIVRTVAFSPDGQTIASGGDDAVIRLWNPATGKERGQLLAHKLPVTGLAFSPDGKNLASVGGDHSALLWALGDTNRYAGIWTNNHNFRSVAFSPDGKTIALGSGLSAFGQGSPSQRYLVGHPQPVDVLTLVDSTKPDQPRVFGTNISDVFALVFSPDGQTLASGHADGAVKLWDVSKGQVRMALTNTEAISGLSFSPDGRHLAVASWGSRLASGKIKILDADTGIESINQLEAPGPVTCLAYSPDGKKLATAGQDQMLRLWDAHNGRAQAKYLGHTNAIWSLAWSPDSRTVATAGWDSTVRLWDAAKRAGRTQVWTTNNFSITFSPDSKTLVSGNRAVAVWGTVSGKLLNTVAPGNELAGDTIVAFAPDGKTLAACASDGIVRIFATNDWNHGDIFVAGSNRISALTFSPDGRLLAFTQKNAAFVYAVSGGVLQGKFSGGTNPVHTLAFTPDSKALIMGDKPIGVWDIASGRLRASYPVAAVRLAVSPDGKKLAVADGRFDVALYDFATMRQEFRIKGHKDEIFGVNFSPDGKTLATASWDGMVKLWQVATGEPLLTFKAGWGMCWSVAFAPDNQTLAFTCDQQGTNSTGLVFIRAAPPEQSASEP